MAALHDPGSSRAGGGRHERNGWRRLVPVLSALLGAHLLPVSANATNTVAMWPGELASVFAFHRELRAGKGRLMPVIAAGALGGAAGAVALLETSQARFLSLVPGLLLFATALFALGDPLKKYLDRSSRKEGMSVPNSTGLFVGLLLVSFYTGYFGAGAGILVFNPAWRRRAYPIIFP